MMSGVDVCVSDDRMILRVVVIPPLLLIITEVQRLVLPVMMVAFNLSCT
jgi:hypothetical protein